MARVLLLARSAPPTSSKRASLALGPGRHAAVLLSPDAELLETPDGGTLLFLRSSGRYLRISPSVAVTISWLKSSPAAVSIGELANALAQTNGRPVPPDTLDTVVEQLLRAKAVVLADGTALPRGGEPVTPAWCDIRLPLWRPSASDTWLTGMRRDTVLLVATLALSAGGAGLLTGLPPAIPRFRDLSWLGQVHWGLIPVVTAAYVATHELGHLIAASCLGVPVRELGVGLRFRMLPFAYSDRTDWYRAPDMRKHGLIALGGPAVDLMVSGISLGSAPLLPESWRPTAVLVGIATLVLAASHLNPLGPGDGARALEGFLGILNLQALALRCLSASVRGGPLSPDLTRLPPSTRNRLALLAVVIVGFRVALALVVLLGAGWWALR